MKLTACGLEVSGLEALEVKMEVKEDNTITRVELSSTNEVS